MARKSDSEPDFDRELADLPPELRWREWKARVEAVLFAAAKPVTREILARVVGRDCILELLLDDLKEDLRGRPIALVRAGDSFARLCHVALGLRRRRQPGSHTDDENQLRRLSFPA